MAVRDVEPNTRSWSTRHRGGQPRKLPRVHQISRQELYNLIWSKPITALAERFGISDRGLAKVCGRSGIPAPPRGHCAQIAAGGTFHRPELPNPADQKCNRILLRVNQSPPCAISAI